MKAKSYRLKYTPTEEQLIKELSAKSGGIWIDKNSKLYISKFFELPKYDFEFSIGTFQRRRKLNEHVRMGKK